MFLVGIKKKNICAAPNPDALKNCILEALGKQMSDLPVNLCVKIFVPEK